MMGSQPVGEDERDDLFLTLEILLDMALELSSKDAELWRLRWELARKRDDREGARRSMSEYVKLVPDDDAAQLEMILTLLKSKETDTLQDRAAKAERLLNSEAGKQLSKPLRSRLGSFVAGTDLETGDGEPDHGWLRYALQTDPTNYAAAHMIYDIVRKSGRPPLEQALGLYGILRANPVDGPTHEALGKLLVEQGAYRQAAEQFEVGRTFAANAADPRMIHDWALSLACSEQRDRALQMMLDLEAVQRQYDEAYAKAKQEAQAAGQDAPEPTRLLTTDLRVLAYCIRLAPGQMQHSAAGPLREIRQRLEAAIAAGDPEAEAQLSWLLVWFNVDQLVADSLVNKLANARGEDDALIRRLRGWQALHHDDGDTARRLLGGIAGEDAFAAYGLAMLEPKRDDPRRRQWLQRAVDLEPNGRAALLAARELHAAGSRVRPTPTGRRMLRMMDTWEYALIKPEPDARPWLSLELEVEPKRAEFLTPLIATVRLRNMTDYPLAIGANAPVPSSLFLYVSPRRGGRFAGRLQPLVVDMKRRLRLEPREVIESVVRLDRGYFPYSIPTVEIEEIEDEDTGNTTRVQRIETINLATERISYTVTALLDPRMTADGRVLTGPMGATDSAELLEFGSSPPRLLPDMQTHPRIERWISAVTEPDRNARADAIARLMSIAPDFINDENEDPEVGATIRATGGRMAEAVNGVFPNLDAISQAWAVMFLPDDDEEARIFDQVINIARGSTDPRVRIAYLIAQVDEAGSDDLLSAMRSENLRIAEFARVYEVLLKRIEELNRQREQAVRDQPPLTPDQPAPPLAPDQPSPFGADQPVPLDPDQPAPPRPQDPSTPLEPFRP